MAEEGNILCESPGTEHSASNTSEDTPNAGAKTKSSNMAKQTRKGAEIFGLGSGITSTDSQITGSRLPTNQQVLRCFMYHQHQGAPSRQTKFETAKLVLAQVSEFYRKANIPMISDIMACQKIIKLADDNAKLRSIPVARRTRPFALNKLKCMEIELNKTFQIWPANVTKLVTIPEDLQFLESMKTDRLASFGSTDKVLSDKLQRKAARNADLMARQAKARQQLNEASASTQTFSPSEPSSSENESASSDNEYAASTSATPSSHRRTLRTGEHVFIPHDILKSPELVALSTRMKLSPAQQSAFTETLIEEVGGDPTKIATSYATADKSRRKVGEQIAASAREMWVPPLRASLHWDSKIMTSLTYQNELEERLTISVGDSNEIKLLGVPSYKPGTDRKSGDIISDLTVNLLHTWNCADSIVNMVFDTTASNTGHLSAACITIQHNLQRALLWSACRHHVGEVILTQVFNDLHIEASRSPEVTLFSRFRAKFDLFPHSCNEDQPLSILDLSQFGDADTRLLDGMRIDTLEILKSKAEMKRDDYLEFIELCKVFLGDQKELTFKRPGAIHKARWMAKLLYSIKITLLENNIAQLPQGTVTTKHQLPKIRDFVIFATIIYSSWWITCSHTADAPWNDLDLYKRLLAYDSVNSSVSQSAIKALKRHLWYLTEEMIPLALFSGIVPNTEKQAIAVKLLAVKPAEEVITPSNRFGAWFGKPTFPDNITQSTSLADLVGPNSWFMMRILQIDHQFLEERVENWAMCATYQTSKSNISAINVVNDAAERAVKLGSDFLSTAKSESHYQNVLQVVEQDRKNRPNLRKRKLYEDKH